MNLISRFQRGASLLEILAALGLISIMMGGITHWIQMSSEDSRGQQAGLYQAQVAKAVERFIQDPTWRSYIRTNATTTVPVKVQVSNLTAGNFLPAAAGTVNSYGQTPCALIYYDNSINRITALITTEGGQAIPDVQLSYTASMAGPGAGAIRASSPTLATGVNGSWSTTLSTFTDATAPKNCSGTPAAAGRLATLQYFDGSGQLISDFLYRDAVPGRPDLNTMNTPILMSASTIQTAGAACTTNGAIARDASGAVLSCQGGTWKGGSGGFNWKGSVANVASLPASGNSSGDAYRITGLSNHIFVWDAQNSVWQGLVVDSAGTLSLPGIIVANGSNSTYGALTIQGAKNGWSGINFKDAGGNNAGTLMMSPNYSGFFNAADSGWRWYVDNTGNSYQTGTAQAGYLQPTTVATLNAACTPNGLVAMDSVGVLLSCQSGLWKKAQGGGTWASCYHVGPSFNVPQTSYVSGAYTCKLTAGNWCTGGWGCNWWSYHLCCPT